MKCREDRILQFILGAKLQSVRIFVSRALLAFSCVAVAAAQQAAQANASQTPTAQAPSPQAKSDASKPAAPQTPQQKQLADDTAKLLTLANELKAELDKSNKDTLSLGVIKKAEQVEKLAHKVRDEMKASLPN